MFSSLGVYIHRFLHLFLTKLHKFVGTTGRPKGATLSHSALVIQSLAKIAIVGYDEDDVCIFPILHLYTLHS